MKKQILKALIVLSALACATSAFATDITSAGTSIGGGAYRPSTNVTVKAIANTTNYAATSQHSSSTSSNGGKQYGTLSGGSTIQSANALDANGPTAPSSATALDSSITWQ